MAGFSHIHKYVCDGHPHQDWRRSKIRERWCRRPQVFDKEKEERTQPAEERKMEEARSVHMARCVSLFTGFVIFAAHWSIKAHVFFDIVHRHGSRLLSLFRNSHVSSCPATCWACFGSKSCCIFKSACHWKRNYGYEDKIQKERLGDYVNISDVYSHEAGQGVEAETIKRHACC